MRRTGSLLYFAEWELPLTMLAHSCSSGMISADFIFLHPYPYLPSVPLVAGLLQLRSQHKSAAREVATHLCCVRAVCRQAIQYAVQGPPHAHLCLWALLAVVRQGAS